jgi:hypothetical protein
MYFYINYNIALSISFTIKRKLFARKEQLANFNFALESKEGDFRRNRVRILSTSPGLVSPESVLITTTFVNLILLQSTVYSI